MRETVIMVAGMLLGGGASAYLGPRGGIGFILGLSVGIMVMALTGW